jgi:hypothetical protein
MKGKCGMLEGNSLGVFENPSHVRETVEFKFESSETYCIGNKTFNNMESEARIPWREFA